MNPKQYKRLSKAASRIGDAWNAGVFPEAYIDGVSSKIVQLWIQAADVESAIVSIEKLAVSAHQALTRKE